jgi:hypothetical protein
LLRGRPRETTGFQEPQQFSTILNITDDEDKISTLSIGPNIPADGPHVRLETPHVQPEVPNNPGEVDNVLQEPGDNCREIFDDHHLKVPLRGSEKRAKNFTRKGFRCGSDRTGLFLAEGGEKKPEGNSMKLLTWNACRLLAGGR